MTSTGPVRPARAVRVRVPATSANLGPGFDSFGLAVSLYDEVEVALAPAGLRVDVQGECAHEVPRDERHLVVRALRAGFERLGVAPGGLALTCRNRIPHGRGLGSSAAAIVAGLVAARALAGGGSALDDEGLLDLASAIEGHPDNVAATLHGGFTIAWTEDRRARAVGLEPAPGVRPVAFVPPAPVATAHARGLLPASVSHEDAAANSARAALLVVALTGRPDLLLAATVDRLHQTYRIEAMPATLDLVANLRGQGIAAVVSGAGPSVLALTATDLGGAVAALAPTGWRAHVLDVDRAGVQVHVLES